MQKDLNIDLSNSLETLGGVIEYLDDIDTICGITTNKDISNQQQKALIRVLQLSIDTWRDSATGTFRRLNKSLDTPLELSNYGILD